ncbi:MAG: ABC transporter ATP-binding protein [Pseudomonadota bacterium]
MSLKLIFGRIWEILTPVERRNALIQIGLIIIGMMFEVLGVGMVIPAISLLTQHDFADRYPAVKSLLEAMDNPAPDALVRWGMLALLGVYCIKVSYLAFLAFRQTRFAFGIRARLSKALFTLYVRQPYTFHLQRNSAQLMRNAIDSINMFTANAMLPSMVVLTEGMVLVGVGTLLLFVEPLGALVVAIVLGSATWGFHRFTHARITRWGKARQYHDGMRIQHLQQGLGGVKDIKLLGREEGFLARYDAHNLQSTRMGQLQAALLQLPRLWLELLAVAGMTLLVLSMLAQGRDMASIVPTMGLFAIAAFRLMPSVNRVLSAILSLRYGLAVLDTLHDELKLAIPDCEAVTLGSNRSVFLQEIRLINLSYTYPAAPATALDGLSIYVRKGESVGFVGSSGAGKSTLVDVILGLLPPDAGQVTVDGRNIQQDLRHWQDQIGYVPQSIYLTDDTLRRNVAFGLSDESIDDAAVRRALCAAQLDDFVASLPDGVETVVGERGIRLSGGQRQRIGIARALYHDPPVLVLDEATSALDPDTESGVMRAITALHGSKTIIIVAHRLSTVEHCDRLYRLEGGKVVEEIMSAEGYDGKMAMPA